MSIRVLVWLTISIGAIFSAGCSASIGDYRSSGCPPLQTYSPEEQKQAAAEIRANPNSRLAKMVGDYGRLRKACRL